MRQSQSSVLPEAGTKDVVVAVCAVTKVYGSGASAVTALDKVTLRLRRAPTPP